MIDIPDIPEVFGKEISVRINRIDTPEKRSKNPQEKAMALKAKMRLEQLMADQKIELKNVARDKYFRLLADVHVNDQSVADILIKEGLARPYFGGKKENGKETVADSGACYGPWPKYWGYGIQFEQVPATIALKLH